MNRCAICGKFRPWASLRFRWSVQQADIHGGIEEQEWFECFDCEPPHGRTEAAYEGAR